MTAPALHILKPAGEVTTAGIGDVANLGVDRGIVEVSVDVAAVGGDTDTVTVRFETALTPVAGFVELDNLVVQAPGPYMLTLDGCLAVLRVKWDLSGTSATFGVSAVAQQCYSTPLDMASYGLPASVLAKLSDEDRTAATLVATDEAASYLGTYFDLPLKSWGKALRMHTANMAAYHAMRRRGFNPDADPTIRMGYTDAIAWLKGTARNDPTLIDSDITTSAMGGYVISQPPRGWERH